MAGQTALIVVDMLNTYEHEDAELLTESVAEAVGPMSDLLSRATDQNARPDRRGASDPQAARRFGLRDYAEEHGRGACAE